VTTVARSSRDFARTLAAVARWRLVVVLTLIIGMPLVDAMLIALLAPTLEAAGLDLAGQGAAGHYAKLLDTVFARAGLHPNLSTLLAFYVVLMVTRSLLERYRSVSTWAVQQRIEDALRQRLYHAIVNAGWPALSRARFADLSQALTAELERVNGAASAGILLAAEIAAAALYLAIAFAMSPPMTLMVIGMGAIIALLLRGRMSAIHRRGVELASHTNQLYGAVSEHLGSLKTAKTYGAQDRNFEIFAAISGRIAATNVAFAREQSLAASWFELGGAAMLIPILYVAVHYLRIPGVELLVLLLLFRMLMPRFQAAIRHYGNFINFIPSFANVIALERRYLHAAEPAHGIIEAPALRREIRLEDVSFSYDEGAAEAVRDVSLAIPAGRITAIIGSSGAGKSTLADLVMGLIAPSRGRVTIDGVMLTAAATQAWRERIGYVGSETSLFHLSIRENLLWARPDAKEAEIWRALEQAAATEFVRALPEQLETIVGERGILLSQGERQRLALARAMLRRPAILILDEATNSLDSDNEARVLGALEAQRGELTVLMIAHRLSTIRWADLIHVMENGALVESGGWEELSARRESRFRALCDAQSLVA
jgi:ATP-binding cassette subfamily C protein